jgi:carboxymethylenebutenolidase
VQAHFATEDGYNTPELVERFQQRMRAGGGEPEVHWYEGADHAFFNDTRPDVHYPEAAELAWERMLGFFRSQLAATPAPAG